MTKVFQRKLLLTVIKSYSSEVIIKMNPGSRKWCMCPCLLVPAVYRALHYQVTHDGWLSPIRWVRIVILVNRQNWLITKRMTSHLSGLNVEWSETTRARRHVVSNRSRRGAAWPAGTGGTLWWIRVLRVAINCFVLVKRFMLNTYCLCTVS